MNWITNIFTKNAANWLVFGAVIAGGSYHITSKMVKAETSQNVILEAIEKQPDEIKKAVEAIVNDSILPRIESIEKGQKAIQSGQESSRKVTKQIILELHLNTQRTVELIEELSEKKNMSYNQ